MRRRWRVIAGILGMLAIGYRVAQWRLTAWYGRDFEAAFRARIAAEVGPGERVEWPADAAVKRRDSAIVQGYVVCGTAVVHGRDGVARTARYAVGFSPTPFGAGAKDLYTPSTGRTHGVGLPGWRVDAVGSVVGADSGDGSGILRVCDRQPKVDRTQQDSG